VYAEILQYACSTEGGTIHHFENNNYPELMINVAEYVTSLNT
jgi:hypothetical protein